MAKQKLKTNRSAAKRMKVTASGKVKRGQAGKRHLLTSKGPSRTGSLKKLVLVAKENMKNVKRMMPYAF
jgi:large subunit ribosomal protein L35